MIRYLRYAFLAVLGLGLVLVALANRAPVQLSLFTPETAKLLGVQNSIYLPLFVVIFGAIIAGVLIGFVWEWFREHKHRAAASNNQRENARLHQQVQSLRKPDEKTVDDVLALLEADEKTG